MPFAAALRDVQDLAPRAVLSAHLPPATGMTDRLIELLAKVPDANPWVGPDQQALEAILGQVHSDTM